MSDTAPLSDREAAFVREYLISRNAMEAYIKAGYSPKSARANAYRMMEREGVRAAIDRETIRAKMTARKTLDDLIEEYTKLGFTGMSRFLRIDANGHPVIDLSDCSPADLDLLAEVTIETYTEGKGKDAQRVKRIKIKPYDRYKALEKLAQYLGLGADLKDPLADKGSVAALLKEVMERGTALPIKPQGPMGSKPKTWKN